MTLDARLAEQVLELVGSAWPRERWRTSDLLGRVTLFSEDREAGSVLRRGLRSQQMRLLVPVPSDLTPPPPLRPDLPRLLLATLPTLQSRPDLLRFLSLDESRVRARLTEQGPSLYWLDSNADVRLLITAQTRDELGEAARAFVMLERAPGPGRCARAAPSFTASSILATPA